MIRMRSEERMTLLRTRRNRKTVFNILMERSEMRIVSLMNWVTIIEKRRTTMRMMMTNLALLKQSLN